MKVSIIVPVYKVEKYVRRCVQSIMDQTLTEGVECIFVNDCTPDRSIDIIRTMIDSYDGNISFKIVEHRENKGSATTRNTGLDNATGDYIIQTDSDDYIEPDMIDSLYKKAVEDNADIVFCDYWDDYSPENKISRKIPFEQDNIKLIEKIINGELPGFSFIKLVRRSLYSENNIRFLDGVNMMEDWRISIMLLYYSQKLSYVHKPFGHYVRYNEGSYSNSISKKLLQDEVINVNSVSDFLKSRGVFESCRTAMYRKQVNLRFRLLCFSKGTLQREWAGLYRESFSELLNSDIHTYWKMGLLGSYIGCLSWFNLFRALRNAFKGKSEEFEN